MLKAPRPFRAPLAIPGLLLIGGSMVAVLLLLADQYGFHRDELYFVIAGRHPDWGYVDQPPLTPLLSAAAVDLMGLSPFAIRILPALAAAATAALGGAIARELGGNGRAQLLAAMVVSISAILGLGHLDSTTTFDVLVWVLVLWLLIRLLAGADHREWLALGLVAGIGLQNKHLVLLLGLGLVIGLLVVRRWDVFRSARMWGGMAVAVVIWLPNLVWQASHGFPQLAMGNAIAENASVGDVLMILPMQLILAGPLLFPIMLVGLWWLLRANEARPWRAVGWAYVAVLVLTIVSRGKLYYPAGFLPVLLAAGSIGLERWLSHGRPTLRAAGFATAAVASGALIAVLMLPILPPRVLAETPIPDVYAETAEQIGWPELVATVQEVVDGLEESQLPRAAILTANYGEAAALELLGEPSMPPVHSGHNSYGDWGPPPDARDVVILVGWWTPERFATAVGDCERRATLGNAAGVENQELGAGVWVCTDPASSWSDVWPTLRHLN